MSTYPERRNGRDGVREINRCDPIHRAVCLPPEKKNTTRRGYCIGCVRPVKLCSLQRIGVPCSFFFSRAFFHSEKQVCSTNMQILLKNTSKYVRTSCDRFVIVVDVPNYEDFAPSRHLNMRRCDGVDAGAQQVKTTAWARPGFFPVMSMQR